VDEIHGGLLLSQALRKVFLTVGVQKIVHQSPCASVLLHEAA